MPVATAQIWRAALASSQRKLSLLLLAVVTLEVAEVVCMNDYALTTLCCTELKGAKGPRALAKSLQELTVSAAKLARHHSLLRQKTSHVTLSRGQQSTPSP